MAETTSKVPARFQLKLHLSIPVSVVILRRGVPITATSFIESVYVVSIGTFTEYVWT
jgi:hypothetical protein